MLGSSRAATNRVHVFISLNPLPTNFTPGAFKGCFRPPSRLQKGFQSRKNQVHSRKPPKHLEHHNEKHKSQHDMYNNRDYKALSGVEAWQEVCNIFGQSCSTESFTTPAFIVGFCFIFKEFGTADPMHTNAAHTITT